MSWLSKAIDKVQDVVHNVAETVVNPVNTIKNSFLVGPLGGQATAAIVGPEATPKQAALITAAGTGAVYGGSLLLGPNLGVVPAAGLGATMVLAPAATATAGSVAGVGAVVPAAGGAVNEGIFEGMYSSLGLGKAFDWLSNPGVTSGGGVGNKNAAPVGGPPFNWKILLIAGSFILVLVLWLRK